jgi:hypothetical protein
LVQPTLSLTEFQQFNALVAFLNGIVPPGTVVIRGQQNRTAEPNAANFVIAWPLRATRLETNETTFTDNVLVGSIAGTVLTVTSMVQLEGVGITNGAALTDGTAGLVNGSTSIVTQLSGSIGGTGTYQVTPSQNISSETMYVGVRADLMQTEWTVQCDCHGPNSANVAMVLVDLFRSEYGTFTFENQPTAFVVEPLWADEGRYIPFINAEQQYEYRWVVDLHLQVNPIVGTAQQFADVLKPTITEFP